MTHLERHRLPQDSLIHGRDIPMTRLAVGPRQPDVPRMRKPHVRGRLINPSPGDVLHLLKISRESGWRGRGWEPWHVAERARSDVWDARVFGLPRSHVTGLTRNTKRGMSLMGKGDRLRDQPGVIDPPQQPHCDAEDEHPCG